MAPYRVFAGTILIGHSDLEFGDPPMGVAFGTFRPERACAAIRNQCIAAREGVARGDLDLSVLRPDGEELVAEQGTGILDSAGLGPNEIEVEVRGIPHPLYH
jgi:hypothetical protein